ncbi:ArsR/SmtB family transcription factor [Micromonospora sp. NPDC050397]|uniref:ArsR/SmtB family transcription factor n=1 Tax=Micromonospora sp. NPDC050397 TaxID=3364279 RepID=UPI0038509E16
MNVTVEDDALDKVLHALADPTRRAILRRLSEGDARVTALAEPFAISLNSVSKHIQTLEHAGLVSRRRSGREHLLSLNPEQLKQVTDWINQTCGFWSRGLAAVDALLSDCKPELPEQERTDP